MTRYIEFPKLHTRLGATYLGDQRVQFLVWAPNAQSVEVHLTAPRERFVTMEPRSRGYHRVSVENVEPGALYFYRLDGNRDRPDPASRAQPQGVHGPSQVVDSQFIWDDDAWFGLPLRDYVIYELHVGTYTSAGTFDAIIPYLDDLNALGITAIELMPVAQFPGNRNWGYDGVYPFAVQNSYGGMVGLKNLVNACHQRGMAVVLDVVYNHFGPEGNYVWDFAPYFTDRYKTPWGWAVNFDGVQSDEVRRYFIENALGWVTDFHVDALRIDAVHAIFDFSARPFLEELAEAVHRRAEELNRRAYVIAESDLNDMRLVRPRELGGYGLDAQWDDDFHHALHTLLTGEGVGYYADFGELDHLVKAFRDGLAYAGGYSRFRQRRHGNSSREVSASKFVVFAQNHDQIGNRMLGERLSQRVAMDGLKLIASLVLLSPFIPMLFMGEEYGEVAPFQYFVSHSDPGLIEAVRKGRREEFAAFAWQGEPLDPQSEETFRRCQLDHALKSKGQHRLLYAFYRELIRLRKTLPALAVLSKEQMQVIGLEKEQALFVRRWNAGDQAVIAFNLSGEQTMVTLPIPIGRWQKILDSGDDPWGGEQSAVPSRIVSEGYATISLYPKQVVLFVLTVEP